MKKTKNIICILLIIFLTAGCKEDGTSIDTQGLLLSEEEEGSSEEPIQDDTAKEQAGEPIIYVQVSGAVKKPGVYRLPEGSRVFQALELAGGMTKEADEKSLNQAQELTDGQIVWVMTAEEAVSLEQPESLPNDDGRINLNTATQEELMTLPGIGEAKAKSILAWREDHGSFEQIEDIMKIEGIKEGVFSKIRDCVKVQ